MKKFKIVDVTMSILLILSCCIYGLFNTKYLIIGYFVVGGWQLASMLVHKINKWFTPRHSARHYYQTIVVVIFCLAGTALIAKEVIMPLMFFMIFASPVMAVYYTWLCYYELTVKMQRPLAALK